MSAFTPDLPPIPQPAPADLLARFVPAALRRTPPVAKVWTVPHLIIRGVATAGFFPCRALQVRVRQTVMMHAQQCGLAAELTKHHVPQDDAAAVTEAATRVRVAQGWVNTSGVLLAAAVMLFVVWLAQHGVSRDSLRQWFLHAPARGDAVAISSVALLSAAYLFNVVQINQQLVALQQFALAINAVCGERLGALDPPPLVWGLRPVHLLVGGVGAYFGLFWFLPMMLAWAAFGDFARDAAYTFRVHLADRLIRLTGVEPVIPTIDLCHNADCRQGLPVEAMYCPRCGAGVVS